MIDRRRIRLFPDFGRDWPLWEDDGENGVLTTSPDDYGLSDDLTARLREWFDFWRVHYDPDTMWDTSANHAKWHAEGRKIATSLREEVREFANVAYLR